MKARLEAPEWRAWAYRRTPQTYPGTGTALSMYRTSLCCFSQNGACTGKANAIFQAESRASDTHRADSARDDAFQAFPPFVA